MSDPGPKLSHPRDSLCRTGATALSHPRDTGSSYKKSYSLISPYRPSTEDPLGEIPAEVEVQTSALRSRPASRGRFLKGPIPLEVIGTASRLPGKALALYLAIQHRCDLEGRSAVTLPAALLRTFGVDRDAKARALRHLEQ